MPASIPYKSFCWSFGTTSFRTKNFNKTIEEQLEFVTSISRATSDAESRKIRTKFIVNEIGKALSE